jgi:DNA end-binding protein Ku
VVDFMSLLQKSLQANTRTPAKKTSNAGSNAAPARKAATNKVAKKATQKTASKATKKTAAKAAPRRKAG